MTDKLNELMGMMTTMKAQHDAETRQRGREIAELRAGGVARSEVSAREEPGTPAEPPVPRAPRVPVVPGGDALAAERAAVTHATAVPTPDDEAGHSNPGAAASAAAGSTAGGAAAAAAVGRSGGPQVTCPACKGAKCTHTLDGGRLQKGRRTRPAKPRRDEGGDPELPEPEETREGPRPVPPAPPCSEPRGRAAAAAPSADGIEDLTPETTIKLLDDLKAGRPVKIGPQNHRVHSEGPMGRTSLTGPPSGPQCRDLSALGAN